MTAPQRDHMARTVYIQLLEEGSVCYRPTQGEEIGEGLYRVLPTENYDPELEVWEFPPGSIVRCEMRTLHDSRAHDCLVAAEGVSP